MFDPKHLAGASSDLVRSMVKVGRKAAELERVKLQAEIQKERSELRRKRLDKRVKMASGKGTKGSQMKSPKQEEEDDDFLEDLVVDSDPKKPATYSTLKPGGFVTKAEDRKGQLEKRRAKMAKNDDDDDDEDETEKEQLERETRELESELRKTERAVEKARDKEERAKATRFSKRIQSGVFLKQPKAVSLVETKKKRKSLKTETILSAEEEDEEDEIPEGFHLQEESPHCLNMQRAEDF